MAALCIGTNTEHFPRTSPFEGSPVQVTIEDSETISSRLSSLHAQLWECALNGSVSPGLHWWVEPFNSVDECNIINIQPTNYYNCDYTHRVVIFIELLYNFLLYYCMNYGITHIEILYVSPFLK